jgi:hypothetical protein
MTFAALGEDLMGLFLHVLFTVPVAFAVLPLIPVVAQHPLSRRVWSIMCVAAAVCAVAGAVVSGTRPPFSAAAPQRLNISFVDDHITGRALWAADPQGPLPQAVRGAAPFSSAREPHSFLPHLGGHTASAGEVRFAPPSLAVVAAADDGNTRRIRVQLEGAREAHSLTLIVPTASHLRNVEIGGNAIPTSGDEIRPTVIHCVGADCIGKEISLTLARKGAVDLLVAEQRYGLPDDGAVLLAARGATGTPSRGGDTTIILAKHKID